MHTHCPMAPKIMSLRRPNRSMRGIGTIAEKKYARPKRCDYLEGYRGEIKLSAYH